MRRHAQKLRVDGLRPDGTYDDLVLVSTLRTFWFLPGDIGVVRHGPLANAASVAVLSELTSPDRHDRADGPPYYHDY